MQMHLCTWKNRFAEHSVAKILYEDGTVIMKGKLMDENRNAVLVVFRINVLAPHPDATKDEIKISLDGLGVHYHGIAVISNNRTGKVTAINFKVNSQHEAKQTYQSQVVYSTTRIGMCFRRVSD